MHTPGPWFINGNTIEAQADPENSKTYLAPVAVLDGDWTADMVKANARLIAAAPDLLSALRECRDYFAANDQEDESPEHDRLLLVEAALAKAEG